MELEGEEKAVAKAKQILDDYMSLVRDGHVISNADLNNFCV